MAQAAVAEVESALPLSGQDDYPAPEPRPPGHQKGQPSPNKGNFTSKRYGKREEEPEVSDQEGFFEMLSGFTPVDWETRVLYVYMWDPIVDLTKGGKENKYRKLYTQGAVTIETLKKDVGSGTYNLKLNQLSPTRKEKTVREVVVNIYDPDFPPNLPPGGWLDDPRNKEWAWAKPLIEKKWAAPIPQAAGDSAALGELARLVTQLANKNGQTSDSDKLSATLVDWALKQTADERKADRDSDSPGKLAELVRAVKELMPAPATAVAAPVQDNTLMTFVLAQLTRLQESNDKLIQTILAQKSEQAKQPDPLNQVETMVKLVTAVSGIVQPAAPREPWQDIVSDLGPKVLELGQSFVTSRAMMQPRPQAQQIRPNPAAVVPTTTQPVPEAQQPQSAPQPTTESEMDTNMRSLIINVAALASNALNLGMDGDAFADQICYKFGQATYDTFLQQMPKKKLMETFKGVPEAWAVLQPFEIVLPSFIDSFYAYATQEPEDDTKPISPQPAPQPVMVPSSKKGKKK